jgi:4-amino-4-deoxy-L-arabinose transferase-like glycosyltransferase
MIKKLLKSNFFRLVAVLFLLLRLPSFFEPYWYDDEGIYLTIGHAIRNGVSLYSQIHDNKPPLLYLIAAFAKTVSGFRLLLFFVMIPTTYLFYKLTRKFLSEKSSQIATIFLVILSSIPLIEGNIANAEIFMLLPTLGAFILFLKASKPLHYLLSGFLLGVSFMIKSPAAVELGVLVFWAAVELLDQKISKKEIIILIKKCLLLLSGFLIPLAFCSAYFFISGGFNYFIYAAVLQNFGYLSSWATGSQSGSALKGGLPLRLLVLSILLISNYLLKRTKKIDGKLFMIISWFFFSLFGALLSGRPYPHYFIEIIPSFAILIAYLLSKNKLYIKLIIIICLAVLTLSIIKYKFYFYRTASYYTNFYSYIIGHKSINEFRNYFGWQVSENYQISEYLKNNSNATDKIFIWGDRASIYALSGRLPVGRFTTSYHIVDFNGYSETLEKFKIGLPKIIVFYDMPGREFPGLNLLIKKYYYLATQIGEALIFQPR